MLFSKKQMKNTRSVGLIYSIFVSIFLSKFVSCNLSLRHRRLFNSNYGTVSAPYALLWLQDEARKLTTLRGELEQFLTNKKMFSENSRREQIENSRDSTEVIVSSNENEVNCRISLDKVPLGRIAVSPCKCIGTNKVRIWRPNSGIN